jgi:hypothetical protein
MPDGGMLRLRLGAATDTRYTCIKEGRGLKAHFTIFASYTIEGIQQCNNKIYIRGQATEHATSLFLFINDPASQNAK